MARKQLSPVLQTRKINSLPKDLKLIAEDLLLEKFGEEKKVAKSTNSFPGFDEFGSGNYAVGIDMGYSGSSESYARFNELANAANVDDRRMERRPEVTARCNPYDRTRVATTPVCTPDFRGLIEALRRLDEQNLPRRDRIFRLEPRFWSYLRQDAELSLHLATNGYASEYTILGCRIIVDPAQCNELEVRF